MERKRRDNVEILINVILYLLLAMAFFSDLPDFINGDALGSGIVYIFIFGILAVIILTIIHSSEPNLFYVYFITIPFFSMLFYQFIRMLYRSLFFESMSGGREFFGDLLKLIERLFGEPEIASILVILIIMLFFWIIYYISKKN